MDRHTVIDGNTADPTPRRITFYGGLVRPVLVVIHIDPRPTRPTA